MFFPPSPFLWNWEGGIISQKQGFSSILGCWNPGFGINLTLSRCPGMRSTPSAKSAGSDVLLKPIFTLDLGRLHILFLPLLMVEFHRLLKIYEVVNGADIIH